jgi:hypothetical protein
MADHIETLGLKPIDILDLTISQEITEDGPWWNATVYWSPDELPPSDGGTFTTTS